MSRRSISFLIVPEGHRSSLKFKLSFLTVRLLVGVLGFLLLFVVVLSIFHGRLLYEVIAGKSLKQENQKLRRYNAKVVELERELGEYKRFVLRVAQLAGVEYQGGTQTQLASYSEGPDWLDAEVVSSFAGEEIQSALTSDSIAVEPGSAGGIPRGAPIEGWITQEFSLNIPGFGTQHPGIDFAAKTGTEVKATADGKVILVVWDDMYGKLVAVDHANGYATYYGHNSKILVNPGDAVRRNQVIALSGNTGRSSAPHLHYEIRKDDVPVDPGSFLNRR
ncbi:MAG: M23 family metallopeptidase [Candidatus Zixiibacteriota bacterium]|nr:MAG: M23 family metallopeptidase [candidate division Zixibacteria bacterium]